MNANIRIDHRAITATQTVSVAPGQPVQRRKPHLAARIGTCLVAPAFVAMLMLGAHWGVFSMASAAESLATEDDGGAEQYFPAEYAFRAADFDDPYNYR